MFKSLNLLFYLVLSIDNLNCRSIVEIKSPPMVNWGNWGVSESCGSGHFAVGFRSKVEPELGKGDDTAMNGIELICSNQKKITSSVGPWGNWAQSFSLCPNGNFLIGFEIKMERTVHKEDDTATNAVRMICEDFNILISSESPWGEWSMMNLCPAGFFICGLKTQVEPPQGKGDDTSLNNILFYCCNNMPLSNGYF